jgi:hypothetical protein
MLSEIWHDATPDVHNFHAWTTAHVLDVNKSIYRLVNMANIDNSAPWRSPVNDTHCGLQYVTVLHITCDMSMSKILNFAVMVTRRLQCL